MSQFQSRLKSLLILLVGLLMAGCAFGSSPEFQHWLLVGLGVAGVLLGAWRLYGSNLLKERRNKALRDEVDTFLELVRQVYSLFQTAHNGCPYPWHDKTLNTLKTTMHDSVERMVEIAENGGEPADVEDKTHTAAA